MIFAVIEAIPATTNRFKLYLGLLYATKDTNAKIRIKRIINFGRSITELSKDIFINIPHEILFPTNFLFFQNQHRNSLYVPTDNRNIFYNQYNNFLDVECESSK